MPTRREQNDLDIALDDLVEGRPVVASRAIGPLVETARAVRAALSVEVPEAPAERHLAALGDPAAMGDPATMGDPGGAPVIPLRGRARGRGRRAAAVVLAAAIGLTLLSATAVAASANALPGQALYPVKRGAERVGLMVRFDRAGKARLHLEFAERRLAELSELLAARRSGEDVDVGAAMRAYNDQVARVENDVAAAALGRDFEALLAHVQAQLQKHVDTLTDLRDNQVPEQARDAIQKAIDNAETARSRAGHGGAASDGGPKDHGKPEDTPGKGPKESSEPSESASDSASGRQNAPGQG